MKSEYTTKVVLLFRFEIVMVVFNENVQITAKIEYVVMVRQKCFF